MILVVEGPSAAGKTSYCRRFEARLLVPESAAGGGPGAGASLEEAGAFWTERNAERWQQSCRTEQAADLAVCDTDPLKLHYSWCLARAGLGAPAAFGAQLRHARRAVAERRLGIADLIVCDIPGPAELRRRRDGDATRTRRNFALHARLAEPLREWYAALGALDPGRVRWHFPSEPPEAATRPRYDLDLFDAWMQRLPGGEPGAG